MQVCGRLRETFQFADRKCREQRNRPDVVNRQHDFVESSCCAVAAGTLSISRLLQRVVSLRLYIRSPDDMPTDIGRQSLSETGKEAEVTKENEFR